MQGGCRAATGGSAAPTSKTATHTTPQARPKTCNQNTRTHTIALMLPSDHEHLLWLYERGRILNHAPPADEDLGDPADFEPIYLSTLEQVAEQADSDQDRLSALFLLAQYRGCDPPLQDRLFKLSDTSKSERVILTALHLLGCAIGLFKRIVRVPRSFGPRAPSIPLPTPAPRARPDCPSPPSPGRGSPTPAAAQRNSPNPPPSRNPKPRQPPPNQPLPPSPFPPSLLFPPSPSKTCSPPLPPSRRQPHSPSPPPRRESFPLLPPSWGETQRGAPHRSPSAAASHPASPTSTPHTPNPTDASADATGASTDATAAAPHPNSPSLETPRIATPTPTGRRRRACGRRLQQSAPYTDHMYTRTQVQIHRTR